MEEAYFLWNSSWFLQ